jgi:hypothetical protein
LPEPAEPLFSELEEYGADEAEGELKPPGDCPQANVSPENISNPQLRAATPADFALVHVLFIVLRRFEAGQVLGGKLYGFTLPGYRCK